MSEVALDGVSKRFGATHAVSNLSLTVEDGAFVVLLGPTGAGKTTTLRLVAGLERPDAGRIRIAGQDVTRDSPAQRDVAFVFQQYSLYPHLSVFDNLAFPLRSPARPTPEPTIRQKVNEVATLLRISDKLDRGSRNCPGVRCSAWPSAARWFARRPFTLWTSRYRHWTQSCAPNCASS